MVFHPPAPAGTRDTAGIPAFRPADAPTEPLESTARMTSLPQALASYAQNLQALPVESVSCAEALNRCLAEAPVAGIDLPPFTQSAVDGYALLSFETGWASSDKPARLQVTGLIAAGPIRADPPPLAGQMAYRILTGARIPRGVDTVVAQERVRLEGDHIRIEAPVPEKRNIRYRGEELRQGDTLAQTGQRVSAGLLAALMAAGIEQIRAYRRPRISVLVTGDEVVPAGQSPSEGQVHDANAPLIRNWLLAMGYPAPQIRYVRDRLDEVEGTLRDALARSDLVISTGGVSVGDHDYLPAAARACGVREVFWKVSQKPGKPLYFGVRNGVALLGLPGNPAAVLVGMVMHARRALDCLEGVAAPGPRLSAGRLLQAVKADPQRDRLVRMNLSISAEGVVHLDPLPGQDSHMLSNLATAMALVMLPARERDYAADERVLWTPLPGVTRI